jgi:glycosyltransferase involved in cell wall biosynthesis
MDSLSCFPLVSVIIPTFNRPDYLVLTVESVLEQTYPNLEIIVVDDASTDNTPQVMSAYKDQIQYIREPVNTGGEQVYLTGLNAARGKYINFLDHDDLMYPQKIALQVQLLESDEQLCMVHCGYHHINEDGQLLETITNLPEGFVLAELLRGDFIWSGAPLIRRSCIDQSDIAKSLFWCSADWARVLAICLLGKPVACIQGPLGAYRILPHSDISNVHGLEEWVIPLLEEVFSHPLFPKELLEMRAEAFARMRFFLACRYYASHQWQDGKRNLDAAVLGFPQVFQNRNALEDKLCEDALGVRVIDAEEFINGMLENLSPTTKFIADLRPHLFSRIHLGIALRLLASGKKNEAQDHLIHAHAYDPELFAQKHLYAGLIVRYCLLLPVDEKMGFIQDVINLWPDEKPLTNEEKRYLNGWFLTSLTIYDHATCHSPINTIKEGAQALLQSPGALKNRGFRLTMLCAIQEFFSVNHRRLR